MPFWKSENAAPVRQHHFRVRWGDSESGILSYTVKSVTKPSVEVSEGVYQVGNHKFKYPGIHTWNDVTIVLVDDKETTRRLIQQFLDQGWLNPIPNSNWEDTYGFSFEPKRFDKPVTKIYKPYLRKGHTDDAHKKTQIPQITIDQHAVASRRFTVPGRPPTFWRPGTDSTFKMDAKDMLLERWTLRNCWIKSINFGQLDYSSDELINIEVTIAYDFCAIQYGDDGDRE